MNPSFGFNPVTEPTTRSSSNFSQNSTPSFGKDKLKYDHKLLFSFIII